jgi:hypothetical protein
MPDNQDYEWLAELLAHPEGWSEVQAAEALRLREQQAENAATHDQRDRRHRRVVVERCRGTRRGHRDVAGYSPRLRRKCVPSAHRAVQPRRQRHFSALTTGQADGMSWRLLLPSSCFGCLVIPVIGKV